jgi:hypothetical protein
MTRVVITQSNYFPWRGWYALIRSVDQLVLYDSVQFTKRDCRNRNRIQINGRITWLTVPVLTKGRFEQKIQEVEVVDQSWVSTHSSHLREASRSTPNSNQIVDEIIELLNEMKHIATLSEINRQTLLWCVEKLGIRTQIRSDNEFTFSGSPSSKLAQISSAAGASTYVTGTAAKAYLDLDEFERRGIEVEWVDYSNLPVDSSLGPNTPELSILSTLISHDVDTCKLLTSFS